MNRNWVILLVLLSLAGMNLYRVYESAHNDDACTNDDCTTDGSPENVTRRLNLGLSDAVEELWTDYAVWTQMYIIESPNNSAAADAATNRMLQNQMDIGNAIKPQYGDAAGNNLIALLKNIL